MYSNVAHSVNEHQRKQSYLTQLARSAHTTSQIFQVSGTYFGSNVLRLYNQLNMQKSFCSFCFVSLKKCLNLDENVFCHEVQPVHENVIGSLYILVSLSGRLSFSYSFSWQMSWYGFLSASSSTTELPSSASFLCNS